MTTVFTSASMSLDGYIASPNDPEFEHLQRWMHTGDVEITTADPELSFRATPPSAEHFQRSLDQTGAFVVGRRMFDFFEAWGPTHPHGKPVVVLTHRPPPDGWPADSAYTFVDDGIDVAVATARELAGGKSVSLSCGTIARQGLNARLVDEVWIDLVPVLLGRGTPFFDQLADVPVRLDGPVSVIEGEDVTHLRYRVRH